MDAGSSKRRTPRSGEIFRNPNLARSLTAVAQGGAAAYYNGSVAAEILASAAQTGLLLTAEDFRTHHGEWVEPVGVTYRENYTIYELPPNPQVVARVIACDCY